MNKLSQIATLLALLSFPMASWSQTSATGETNLIADEVLLPVPADRRVLGDDLFFRNPRTGYRVFKADSKTEVPLEDVLGGFIKTWVHRYPAPGSEKKVPACLIGPNCMNAVASALGLETELRQMESAEFAAKLDQHFEKSSENPKPGDVLVYSRNGAVTHTALFVGSARRRDDPTHVWKFIFINPALITGLLTFSPAVRF